MSRVLQGGLWLTLLAMSYAVQAQTCKPESIPASTPNSQLQDNGDGTITDTKTGLIWKRCLEGQSGSDCASGSASGSAEAFTWQQALQRAQTVNSSGGFAGFSDWRLPTIKELSSLVEHQCVDPAINLTRFPNASNHWLWSSSAVAGSSNSAWLVGFSHGYALWGYRSYNGQLRLVRSGQ